MQRTWRAVQIVLFFSFSGFEVNNRKCGSFGGLERDICVVVRAHVYYNGLKGFSGEARMDSFDSCSHVVLSPAT